MFKVLRLRKTIPSCDSASAMRTVLIAIDRAAIASVRSVLRFIVDGTKANSAWRGVAARTNVDDGGRENRDFRLPAVLFRVAGDKPALSTCAREIRRAPTTSAGPVDVCSRIDPDTPLWDIEPFFCRPSRLRAAVVIRKSTEVCKDRALKRRNLSRRRTYEF